MTHKFTQSVRCHPIYLPWTASTPFGTGIHIGAYNCVPARHFHTAENAAQQDILLSTAEVLTLVFIEIEAFSWLISSLSTVSFGVCEPKDMVVLSGVYRRVPRSDNREAPAHVSWHD